MKFYNNNNLAFLLGLITFALIISISKALVSDFCVADKSLPLGPAGYPCKKNVTVDDFIYTGFRKGGTPATLFNNSVTLAYLDTYPGMNGLGISLARLDFGVKGVIPLHTHPRATQTLRLAKGSIIAGFIDTKDVAYYKKLQVGDVIVFPQGLLHFQVNVGDGPALAFTSLNNANPGIQRVSSSLFAGNLPADLVEKITLIDREEVIKLEKAFKSS